MFSPTKQSRSKTVKRNYSELEQFSSDELMTDGLNRLSLNKHQKLARKLARDFVRSESSMQSSLTPQQPHGESIRFMDFLVQTTVDKHSKNPGVLEAAKKYSELPNTPTARANGLRAFEIECQPHTEQELAVNAGFELANATSNICNQMALLRKDTEFGRFAQGLGAMAQAAQGVYQISQASALMSQAANGAMTMASGAMMLGAVGAVIAAGVMMYSLCSEEEDTGNGLGEALQAIHSAVMEMWEDTRRNFTIVFEKLDILDEKITEMERQNWKRFVASMRAIEHYSEMTRKQLSDLKTAVQGGLNDSHQKLESYMQTFARSDSREVVAFIGKVGQAKDIETLANHSNKLEEWLTQRAAISGCSGSIPTRHGKLDVETQTLITLLKNATADEVITKGSISLGLYASLAQSIDPHILYGENIEAIVNPQDWSKVLASYIDVIQAGIPLIMKESSLSQQQSFVTEVSRIKNIPLLILNLLSGLYDSNALWEQLIDDYQQAVIGIQNQVSKILEEQRQALNTAYDIDSFELVRLDLSAEENTLRVNNFIDLKTRLSKDFEPAKFLAKQAISEDACDDSLGRSLIASNDYNIRDWFGDCYPILTGETRYLTESQIRGLLEVHSGRDRLIALFQHPSFLLAHQFKLAALHISCYGERKSQDTFVHINIGLLNEERVTPLYDMQFPVFYNRLYNYTPSYVESCDNILPALHKVIHWAATHHASMDTLPMGMRIESIVLDPHYQLAKASKALENTIENTILKPARKLAGEKIRINMELFECARLKLLSFIKLLNPSFEIDLDYAQNNIQRLVSEVQLTGAVESLQTLLHPNFGANLLQSDLGFPATSNPSQPELVDLVNTRVKQQPLFQHRLWKTMAHAYASVEMLEQKLIQTTLEDQTVDMQQHLERKMYHGMMLLSAHHQQMNDVLQRVRPLLHQAKPLITMEAISEDELEAVESALHTLDTQFTYAVNATKDLSDNLDADYIPPKPHQYSTPLPHPLTERKKGFISQRLEEEIQSTELPFSETVSLLEHITSQNLTLEQKNLAGGILFLGRTGVGKTSVVNECLGADYHKEQTGPKKFRLVAQHREVFKVGHSSKSETFLPGIAPYGESHYIVDMPGYDDNRGKSQKIANAIAMQWVQFCFSTISGLVLTCDERDFYDSKFTPIRTSFEQVGRLLEPYSGEGSPLMLAITKSRGDEDLESITEKLSTWESELGDSIEDQMIKRTLSFLRRSPESLVFVDVLDKASQATFEQRLQALTPITVKEFNFSPVSIEMELFNKILRTILRAKQKIEQDIHDLTYSLAKQLRTTLHSQSIEMPATLEQLHENLKISISLMGEAASEDLFDFIQLLNQQKDSIHWFNEMRKRFSTALNIRNTASVLHQGDFMADELMEKYNELRSHQTLFERLSALDQVLHPSEESGYETDDDARDLLEEDTRTFLSIHRITLIDDEHGEFGDETSGQSIWIKPDETPGLRILRPAYHAVGKSSGFLKFFNDKGYRVSQMDEDISVRLNIKSGFK